MVLTPEDVLKRTFPSTHLRRGYEENPVDDFLDEVVVELRRLNAEISELRADGAGSSDAVTGTETSDASDVSTVGDARDDAEASGGALPAEEKAAYEARITDLEAQLESLQSDRDALADAGERDGAAAATDVDRSEDQSARVAELEADLESVRGELAAAEADKEEALTRLAAAEQPSSDPQAPAVTAGASAAAVLTRAQELHDELVSAGEQTKSELVTEGETYRDRVVGEADARATELVDTGQFRHDELIATGQSRHDELLAEAESTRGRVLEETESAKAAVLADLGRQRGGLETRIRELGDFESHYRSRLGEWMGTQAKALEAGLGLTMPAGLEPEDGAEPTPENPATDAAAPGAVRSQD